MKHLPALLLILVLAPLSPRAATPTPSFSPTPACCQPTGTFPLGTSVATGILMDQAAQKFYATTGSSGTSLLCFNFSGSSCGSLDSGGLNDAYDIALNPDGASAWVADSGHSRLVRIDLSSGAELESLNISADAGIGAPHGIGVDAAGSVYACGGTRVARYDLSGTAHVLGNSRDLGGLGSDALCLANGRVYIAYAGSSTDEEVRILDPLSLADLAGSPVMTWTDGFQVSGIVQANGEFLVDRETPASSVFDLLSESVGGNPAWTQIYQCNGSAEARGIAVRGTDNTIFIAQKFSGTFFEYSFCVALPTLTPTPTPTGTVTPTFSASPTQSASPTASPGPTLTATPSPSATLSPSASPTAGPGQPPKLYPNPVHGGQATLDFGNSRGGPWNFEVFDEAGQRRRQLNWEIPPGTQKIQVDLSGLGSGAYFWRLRSGAKLYELQKILLLP